MRLAILVLSVATLSLADHGAHHGHHHEHDHGHGHHAHHAPGNPNAARRPSPNHQQKAPPPPPPPKAAFRRQVPKPPPHVPSAPPGARPRPQTPQAAAASGGNFAYVRYGPVPAAAVPAGAARQKVPQQHHHQQQHQQQQLQQQQQQPPAKPQKLVKNLVKVKKVTKPKKYVPPPPPAPAGAPPPPSHQHHKKQPVPVRPRHVPVGVRPGARLVGHRVPPPPPPHQPAKHHGHRRPQFKRKPAVPAVPAVPVAVPAVPAGVPPPPPQLKREVKKVVIKKVPVAVVKALPQKKPEDPTKYLFPPYVAPSSIRQPGSGGARDKRKTPAQANSLALSTSDFLALHENDREKARAAASKLIPKTVPAPSKKAPPPPKRVGRQIKNLPSAVPSPTPTFNIRPARDIGNNGGGSSSSSSSGLSGLFSSIKKRFGFKTHSQRRPAQAPRHQRRPHLPHREHAARRKYKKQIPAQSRSKLPYTNPESIPGYQTFTLAEVITPEKAASRSDDLKVIKVIEAADVTPPKREKKQLDAQESVKVEKTEEKEEKKKRKTTTTSEKKGAEQR